MAGIGELLAERRSLNVVKPLIVCRPASACDSLALASLRQAFGLAGVSSKRVSFLDSGRLHATH
ncbi:hypothetical protein [Candidatus Accumulibacter sp. ACC003]|uniref:hypothetical protein n=1 Tax=Candidatus Accumulibacter sp. ACC003 TaxID=2823334 RepID=UPI0025B874F0|nr:hypothetical protein [Candidatus Accumulibacter sp. ACC003]